MTDKRADAAYWLLLLLHTMAAVSIIAFIQSVFRTLLDTIGFQQQIAVPHLLLLATSIVIAQTCYWTRHFRYPIPEHRNVLLGHILVFVSKISFIFGGALFSVFFLRHIPEMSKYQSALDLTWRGAIVVITLFALYCYTFELEKLGNSLQRSQLQG